MRSFLLLIGLVFLVGCGSGKGGSSDSSNTASSTDPNIGTYYSSGTTASGDFFYSGVSIQQGNVVKLINLKFPKSSISQAYMRKYEGKYEKSGDTYQIKWDYETCHNVGEESVEIKSTKPSDRIFVKLDNQYIQFLNVNMWGNEPNLASTSLVVTEDVNCNLF